MNFDDILDVSSDILDAVTDAIEKNDYSNLASNIRQSAKSVMPEGAADPLKKDEGGNARPFGDLKKPYHSAYADRQPYRQHYGTKTMYSSGKTPFESKNVPATMGTGKIISGTLGTITGAFLAGTFGVFAASISAGLAIGAVLGGAIAAGGIGMILTGRKQKALVDTYHEYADIVGDAEYVEVREISEKTGTTSTNVVKNLEQMMKEDILPKGWFDPKKTTLMLTDNAHNQYLQAEESRKEREAREQEAYAAYKDLPPEVQKLLKEGDDWRAAIRRYNDEIEGVVMSEKLDRLESIMDQIFTRVKNEPGVAGRLRKLMNYYLPTTEKLLKAYVELDRQQEVQETKAARLEIEESFDSICEAFERLFESLFEEMHWDISSDITVMKNMMKQDGLLEE